jgi:plastocyanin
MRAFFILVVFLFLGILVAGCTAPSSPAQTPASATPTSSLVRVTGSTGNDTATGTGETVYVRIRDNHFDPELLSIKAGTTVIWKNEDQVTHTVTHLSPNNEKQYFDSGALGSGQTFTYTFTTPGRYNYGDTKHGGATYLIIVI